MLCLPRMHVFHVRLQTGQVTELLSTVGAAEGLGAGVSAAVGGGDGHATGQGRRGRR